MGFHSRPAAALSSTWLIRRRPLCGVDDKPDWVLNAGAYTAVDRAESEPEVAQVSTDFVFSGQQGSPFKPEQPLDPLWVYVATKAAGEAAVWQLPGEHLLRTS